MATAIIVGILAAKVWSAGIGVLCVVLILLLG